MALWTLFGLTSGKATTSWPHGDGTDGQDGVLGMPRYDPAPAGRAAQECASVCPTRAIQARDGALAVDYGRCVVCQLCTEACPTGAMEPSNDWAFGVRDRADLVWSKTGPQRPTAPAVGRRRVSSQPAHPPRRCGIVQRMRIRTASPQQSLLQSASAGHFLHALAPLCRSAPGDWTCHPSDARAARGGLRGDAGAAVGDGCRNLRGVWGNCGRQLCLRNWT